MVSIQCAPGYKFECSSSSREGDGGGGDGGDGGGGDGGGYSGSGKVTVGVVMVVMVGVKMVGVVTVGNGDSGGSRTTQMCEISLMEGTW